MTVLSEIFAGGAQHLEHVHRKWIEQQRSIDRGLDSVMNEDRDRTRRDSGPDDIALLRRTVPDAIRKEASYRPSKMSTHFRRVTPHERRRAFALAIGQMS